MYTVIEETPPPVIPKFGAVLMERTMSRKNKETGATPHLNENQTQSEPAAASGAGSAVEAPPKKHRNRKAVLRFLQLPDGSQVKIEKTPEGRKYVKEHGLQGEGFQVITINDRFSTTVVNPAPRVKTTSI